MSKTCKDCKWYDNSVCTITGTNGSFVARLDKICQEFEESNHAAESTHDSVNAPDHYCHGGIECKDCIKAALGDNYIGFLIGTVIKYTYRYRHKNGIEDLKKAQVYLGWAIDELAGESDDM